MVLSQILFVIVVIARAKGFRLFPLVRSPRPNAFNNLLLFFLLGVCIPVVLELVCVWGSTFPVVSVLGVWALEFG